MSSTWLAARPRLQTAAASTTAASQGGASAVVDVVGRPSVAVPAAADDSIIPLPVAKSSTKVLAGV